MTNENSSKEILSCLKEISNNVSTLINLIENCENNHEFINEKTEKLEESISQISDISNVVNSCVDNPNDVSDFVNNEISELDTSYLKENTLIISEIKNSVTLPYYISDLNSILAGKHNKYENYDQIINELYTIPLSYYKHSSISRFKEAFNLVRNREHGSLKDAIELGIEVFSNYNLHPAVISACKNLNEFDIYLSCMEYNELDDFHFFNVEFDMSPMIVKNKFDILKKLQSLSKNNISEI